MGTGVGVVPGVGVFTVVVAGAAVGSCVGPLAEVSVDVGMGVAVVVGPRVDVAVRVPVCSGVGAGVPVQAPKTTAMATTAKTAIQRIRREGAVISVAPITMSSFWWAILDSNQGPQSYQDCALTT